MITIIWRAVLCKNHAVCSMLTVSEYTWSLLINTTIYIKGWWKSWPFCNFIMLGWVLKWLGIIDQHSMARFRVQESCFQLDINKHLQARIQTYSRTHGSSYWENEKLQNEIKLEAREGGGRGGTPNASPVFIGQYFEPSPGYVPDLYTTISDIQEVYHIHLISIFNRKLCLAHYGQLRFSWWSKEHFSH